MAEGADGLSMATLRASREAWWDDHFTDLLVEALPADVGLLVDVGCGLATAALTLLPRLPKMEYVGVDVDGGRLDAARRDLAAVGLGQRVELKKGDATELPVGEALADAVLTVMTLQHLPDVPAALRDALRVLRPGGQLVAVEPDNLGQRFYFDGALDQIDAAIRALCEAHRHRRAPADLGIGPRVPGLMAEAGFVDVDARAHAIHSLQKESCAAFFNRVRGVVEAVQNAAGLPADDPVVGDCNRAVRAAEARIDPDHEGYACQLVPVFRVVGKKPR
jgi:SAM-dependent methyltransferase